MRTIPNNVWAKVIERIKRDDVRFYVAAYKGNPELYLHHHTGYGEYESASVSIYVERVSDYEYEDGEFEITLGQMTSLEDLYIEQVRKEMDKLEEFITYNNKVYKNA